MVTKVSVLGWLAPLPLSGGGGWGGGARHHDRMMWWNTAPLPGSQEVGREEATGVEI